MKTLLSDYLNKELHPLLVKWSDFFNLMNTYTIEDLTGPARQNLQNGIYSVYEILPKHIKRDKRNYLYTLKYAGRTILFKHEGKTKILNYGI